MKIPRLSWIGALLAAGYAGSIFLFRAYSWHCRGTNCVYALVVPFLPWAVLAEPWINERNAVVMYAVIAALNAFLVYLFGWGAERTLRHLWRRWADKRMKTILLIFTSSIFLLSAGTAPVSAQEDFGPIGDVFEVTPRAEASGQTLASVCAHAGSGLRIACHPDWQVRLTDRGWLLRISSKPSIDVHTSYRPHQQSTGIRFGWTQLRALNRYAGWFDMTQRHECGRKIVHSRGYLAAAPRARAFDYYLADWEGLYMVQFTVDRAVEFDQYRGLFEEIIDSVEFVTENRDTVNFRAPNHRQCQTITRE